MDILIRSLRIIDPSTNYPDNTLFDILIRDGIIREVSENIASVDGVKEFDGKGLMASPGWFDLTAFLADPGFEHREDIRSGMAAAAAGGFTGVCTLPNTYPAVHSKTEVQYIINRSAGGMVDVFPIGAISYMCEGKDITEIYDMHHSGAVAFSDGINHYVNAGLMQRALLYVKPFNGVVINYPDEKSISNHGHMHEGLMSTLMGMSAIPSLSEELVVARDLSLLEYTGSRLHLGCISTSGSVELVRQAKKKGLPVTCSVAAFNLLFSDEKLESFDSNYKVMPPLRSPQDVEKIKEAVSDGTIDAIVSAHTPLDEESKDVEFDYASFGITNLETAFSMARMAMGEKLDLPLLVNNLAIQPRKILNMDVPVVAVGEPANLTLFNTDEEWVYTEKITRSKSKNSPMFGATLTGRVVGIVNNNQTNLM